MEDRKEQLMFWHILGKDLQRRKTMNVIMFLFIVLAATFLASSISNLVTLSGAVDYFFSISNIPDLLVVQYSTENTPTADGSTTEVAGEDALMTYLQESPLVTQMQIMDFITPGRENLWLEAGSGSDEEALRDGIDTLLLGYPSDQFMKVFDLEDQPLALSSGEIAIPRKEALRAGLKIGDKLFFRLGDIEQEFTIAALTKDAAFGSVYVSMAVYYLSPEDYKHFADTVPVSNCRLYLTNSSDIETLMSQLRQNRLLNGIVFQEDIFNMTFILDFVVAGILMVVSACLILFAFLILRFTILLTLQEDFKEIGVMKAIGIGDSGIRRIYLVKYLSMSILGSGLGLLLSFPIGGQMLGTSMVNIVSNSGSSVNVVYHILSAVFVAGLVLLFCYRSLGKLRRISVMDAIRRGSNGERFHAKSLFPLHKRKIIRLPLYLACNDILCNIKRFIILTFVYIMGFLMILLPLSALRTLQSDDIILSFSMRKVTAFIDNKVQYLTDPDETHMLSDMDNMRQKLEDNGLHSLVYSEGIYAVTFYFDNPDELYNYFAWQSIGFDGDDYALESGRFPKYDNEVLLTDVSAKLLGAKIGDQITLVMPQGEKKFIITGLYQSMDNMGEGMRFGGKSVLDRQSLVSLLPMNVEVLRDTDKEDALALMKEIFPVYTVQSPSDFLDKFLGGTLDQINLVVVLAAVLVIFIIVLVTVLMGKGFLCREHGDVAILKCLGLTDFALKKWQTYRVLVILTAAAVLGCVLSVVLLPVTIEPIFAMMGGENVDIVIRPWESFLVWPMVLLIAGGVSAYLAVGELKHIDCREVNSAE
jgi:putative ABC transport system permease protein